jgi:16S rRNA (cytosine967-C5)-methyltransferase
VESGSVVGAPALAGGGAIVQDEGSQIAGHVAPVAPGHAVLDVCGAPGGKALIYAALAGPAGRLVACDVRARRVALLAGTLRRGHAPRAAVVHIGADAPLPFSQVFDVVTVDAPCSGLGTLRRDPDIKWRRDVAQLDRFAALQLDLLQRAAAAVRAGGLLVYTTCSSEREENAAVVERFLAGTADFRVRPADRGADREALAPFVGEDGFVTTHPVHHGLECYFGAVLERTPAAEGRAGAPQALVIQ